MNYPHNISKTISNLPKGLFCTINTKKARKLHYTLKLQVLEKKIYLAIDLNSHLL